MLRQFVVRQTGRHTISRRFLANSTLNSTTQKSAQSLPPQPQQHPRKPKVDLRPAPIKQQTLPSATSSASATATGSSAKLSEKTPHKSFSEAEQSNSTSSTISEITKSAQHDIKHATEHGVLAPPPADASWARRMLHQAIELFKFYYRGVKMINTHRLQVAAIRQRINSGGAPLTRKEARFIDTFRQDIKKLVPFLIIVIILEEVIPLIALYAPAMLPSTCILPSQRSKIHAKKQDKAIDLAKTYRDVLASGATGSILNQAYGPIALCAVLRISTMGPDVLRRRRIAKQLEVLQKDDERLQSEDMGALLSDAEVNEALEERGVTFGGLSPTEARNRLTWWLKAVSDKEAEDQTNLRQSLIAQRLPSFK
jgi:hypothetical protein